MNEKYIAKFDEGVKAGLDGRPMTVTYVRDVTDEVWDDLAIKSLNIKLQAKQRAKNPSPTFAYGNVNDGEVTVSSLLARTFVTAPPTPQQSAVVISEQPFEKRLVTMVEAMGLPTASVQAYIDHQFEQAKITEVEHMYGCDYLTSVEAKNE